MKEPISKKKTKRREIGDLGESLAVRFLEAKSFILLSRNYLKPWGEIDIICKKGKTVHFVEVKTVSYETGGFRAEDNVHASKLKRLERTINSYLEENRLQKLDWQMDLIVVNLDRINKKS